VIFILAAKESSSSITMRPTLALLSIVFIAAVLGLHMPRTKDYGDEEGYRRRKDPEEVDKKMVQYWSRPDVLPKLPEGMKEKVEVYIKKYPEYQYRRLSGSSERTSSSGTENNCPFQ
jgi:hypothetical protein